MRRVIMSGLSGRTGSAVARHLFAQPDVELVAAVGKRSAGQDVGEVLGFGKTGQLVYPDVTTALIEHQADVYVDFTTPEAAEGNVRAALSGGLDLIVGTTGMNPAFVKELGQKVKEANRFALLSSNFSMGIVALSQVVKLLRDYYGTKNMQIIETHHENKIDMPSGTALYLQQLVHAAGEEPIEIHSIRVPKKTSKHQVLVSINGEIISLEHEVTNPDAFGSGVYYVIKNAKGSAGFYSDLASFVESREVLATL